MRQTKNETLTSFTRVVILSAFCFAGAVVGQKAAFLSDTMVLIWPPAGIGLAAILLFGYHFWPGVAAASALFSLMLGMPLGYFTLGTIVGDTMGAVVCAFLVKRITGFGSSMERTRDVIGYVGLACFLGTIVSAGFNIVAAIYSGRASWVELAPGLMEWWVPTALACLVIAPCILTWSAPSAIRFDSRLAVEASVCGLGLVGGTLLSFHSWFVYGIQNYPLAYLPFPFLVWSALRFGPRGAATGTFVVSVLSIHSLLARHGPFVSTNERESLMLMGCYLAVLAVTNLLLAAAAAERREAERAVSESERRYRAVVEDQTDLINRFGPDGTLTFVNGAFCRFHGKRKEELLGANFLQSLSEEDREIPLSYFRSLSWEQPSISFDHRVHGPDGRFVWQQCTIRRLFGEEGSGCEFQAVIQDITQRKLAEQTLRASEEKYRSLVANIPDVVWTVNANGELTYISANAEKVLGYGVAELLNSGGPFWSQRIHPNDADEVRRQCEALFERNQPLNVEYRIRRKDGQWVWLHNRAPSMQFRDGVLCADGLFSEVTQRKQVEQALEQAKNAAEAANRAKSQFLASMSHELRTPLNAIIGFSEILADQTFGALNARQIKYANNVLVSGRHLLQLINDILDLSKIEAGRIELTRSSFAPATALQNILAVVKTLTDKKKIQIALEMPCPLPPLIADEAKFKQILYNLLSNAIKFTPDGGRITVSAAVTGDPNQCPTHGRHGSDQPGQIRIAVADTGIGVHAKDHDRIFVEFEQVDSSYGRQQQGTGLGLALTKRLVEMHGGQIWVESEGTEGKGSRFIFTLPLFKSLAPVLEVKNAGDDHLRPLVLIVMKDSEVRPAIAHHLRGTGYSVTVVADPDELRATLRGRRPYAVAVHDQVVSQFAPPEMAEVRSLVPARIPVLIFSLDADLRPAFRRWPGETAEEGVLTNRLIDAIHGRRSALAGKEVCAVLIIDDEPALSELLAKTLVGRGFQVLQAGDGHTGLALAASRAPDVIILDLVMPDIDGRAVVEKLRACPATKSIPILVHTGTPLNEEERHRLAAHVHSITAKTETQTLIANLERVGDLRTERLGEGAIR